MRSSPLEPTSGGRAGGGAERRSGSRRPLDAACGRCRHRHRTWVGRWTAWAVEGCTLEGSLTSARDLYSYAHASPARRPVPASFVALPSRAPFDARHARRRGWNAPPGPSRRTDAAARPPQPRTTRFPGMSPLSRGGPRSAQTRRRRVLVPMASRDDGGAGSQSWRAGALSGCGPRPESNPARLDSRGLRSLDVSQPPLAIGRRSRRRALPAVDPVSFSPRPLSEGRAVASASPPGLAGQRSWSCGPRWPGPGRFWAHRGATNKGSNKAYVPGGCGFGSFR